MLIFAVQEIIKVILDIFLHLDKNLALIIGQYGNLTYFLLFMIVFMETGFVVTPFLPGDSLLFAAGALSAKGILSILPVYILLLIAAVAGDTANYWIGHFLGPKFLEKDHKIIKKKYIEDTHKFYQKYGNKTIVLARFVPIVRTFAPFVAGVAKMNYQEFITYNAIGGFMWVTALLFAGYFFGNIGFIKNNFEFVVLAIVGISILPIAYELSKKYLPKK